MSDVTTLRPTGVMTEVAGRPVTLHHGDVVAEYGALRRGAMLVDRSERGRLRMSGPKAAEMLTGMVTNDVAALAPGQGQYAAALTPKGKILADLRIFAEEGSFLVDAPARAAEGWLAAVRKFVNPRLVPYRDEREALRDIGLFGLTAHHVVSALTGIGSSALGALEPYHHTAAEVDGTRVLVARVPDLALEGFELFVPAEAFPLVWQRALAAGATPGGLAAFDIARVEAGRPEWGVDIDDTTIPQEANFDELGAISYTKGCYIGQETVARVHFRGHVNRHLRGLRYVSPEPVPFHASLFDGEGKPLGDVRSAVLSPRLGGVALGMVRREVELGTQLVARWEGGERRVDVSHIPFPL